MLKVDFDATQAGIEAARQVMSGSVEMDPEIIAIAVAREVIKSLKSSMGDEDLQAVFSRLSSIDSGSVRIAASTGADKDKIRALEMRAEKYTELATKFAEQVKEEDLHFTP